ncbi:MAG: hypothetical protein OEV91_07325, partial [Desulfobulbaceae bacterium]|nr:hypothetical protein [Desulfobulbaceae bacterium]
FPELFRVSPVGNPFHTDTSDLCLKKSAFWCPLFSTYLTWPQDQWKNRKGTQVAFPVYNYTWESHLDASLPEGFRAYLPAPWLAQQLGLSPDPTNFSSYRDVEKNCQFIGVNSEPDGSSALINAAIFQNYLDTHGLECVWLLIAERNAWPGGQNTNAAWRRTEGVCWRENGKLRAMIRDNDGRN